MSESVRVVKKSGPQYAVWNKTGHRPYKFFSTCKKAREVATAMAATYPGQTFHVVRFTTKHRLPLGPDQQQPTPDSKRSLAKVEAVQP